jgi:type III pantothenate kinase
MLLVADIGNSSTVLGIRESGGAIVRRWRIGSDRHRTPDEVGALLRALLSAADGAEDAPTAACLASVVPPLTAILAEAIEKHLGIEAHEFRYAPELGIRLDVDEPAQVGPDRVANTLGVHLGYLGPAIVVDFGTATNFDVVSADGAFLGGIIAPGIESGFETFTAATALLPRIARSHPQSFIGKTTVANVQIGVYGGAVAMVDGLISRIRDEWDATAQVIATGGLSSVVGPDCRSVDVIDADLTLKGIGWGYERLLPATA